MEKRREIGKQINILNLRIVTRQFCARINGS